MAVSSSSASPAIALEDDDPSPLSRTRGGDPTLSSASATEEEFMQVLDEMNRICGEEDVDKAKQSDNYDDDRSLDSSPLEPLFENKTLPPPPLPLELSGSPGSSASKSPQSASSSPSRAACSRPRTGSTRSRHCSANSSLSCVSFDSAIGDVYSVQTPPVSTSAASSSSTMASTTSSSSGTTPSLFDTDMLFSSTKNEANNNVFEFDQDLFEDVCASPSSTTLTTPSAAMTTASEFSPPQAKMRRTSSSSWASSSINNPTSTSSFPPSYVNNNPRPPHYGPHRHWSAPLAHYAGRPHHPPGFSHHRLHPAPSIPLHVQRREVEMVCLDLLHRFHHSSSMHPRHISRAWFSRSDRDDPLLITTRLLADAITRLRIFLFGLEPMTWLSWVDRNILYAAGVCAVAILKVCIYTITICHTYYTCRT